MAFFNNSTKYHYYFRSILLLLFTTFFIFYNSTLISSCSNLQSQRQLPSQAKVHISTSSVSSSSSTIKTGNNFGKGKVPFEGDEHLVPSGPNPISNRVYSANYSVFGRVVAPLRSQPLM